MLQTALTVLIGLAAAAYLFQRWWPAWQRLWQPARSAASSACTRSEAQGVDPGVAAPSARCGQGCGQCGSATPAQGKDHRVHVVRHAAH